MNKKTKEIVCENVECKKIETISLYSNIKYCSECKNKFKPTRTIQCFYCKKKIIVPSNIKEAVCENCKKEGKILPKYQKLKKVICCICNNETLVPLTSSNSSSVCNLCKNKGYKSPLAVKTGSMAIHTIRKRTEEQRKEDLKKQSNSLKQLYKDLEKKKKIVESRKRTYLKKTGGKYDHQMKDPNIVKKVTEKRSLKQEEINEKTKKTNLEKRGYEYSLQDPKVREKGKESSIIKRGVDHWTKSEEGRKYLRDVGLEKYCKNRERILDELEIELNDVEYVHSHFEHNWLCKKCNNIFKTIWNNIQQGYLCPVCYPRRSGTSTAETEIFNFLKEILPADILIIKNSKKIIYPYELDIYIPTKNIAIEHNGLFWHKDYEKNYHLIKSKKCEEKKIKLIHIFEDEWIFKKEIVKFRLKYILNVFNSNVIYARNCDIKEITTKEKDEFLKQFHSQGSDISKIRLGAFYNNKLVSVMTFTTPSISKGGFKEENIWELNRFCSDYNYHIPGIAGKLLEHFKRNYRWKRIFSYADRRWSQGRLYYKLGFKLDYITEPNYWYTKNYKRIHRFNLRKRPDEPKDMSEKILRLNEGYNMIWDCGNYKFSLENNLV